MKKNNREYDLSTAIYLIGNNLKIEGNIEYTIKNVDENIVYLFDNYEDFVSYFSKYGLDKKDLIDSCILYESVDGSIITRKKLCDYTITSFLINKVKRGVMPDEKDKIHSRGCLTPLEKVQEWECYGICAPSDDVASLTNRCEYFNDCYDCMLHYASIFPEYDPIEINPDLVRKQEEFVKIRKRKTNKK